jgi:hypothetical protein
VLSGWLVAAPDVSGAVTQFATFESLGGSWRESARLKPLPCELEYVVKLAWRCLGDAFKLQAGKELIRAIAYGQLLGNVVQRCCICRINQFSELFIGLLPRLCPEPKGGEQHRSVFNEVVGVVHNEVVGGV